MNLGFLKRIIREVFPEKPALDNAARVDDYLKTIKQLPSLSETVVRAMALANDDSHEISDLIDIVKNDGAMTALFLKFANSVHFGNSKAAHTIEKAVVRIGMFQCNRIIMTVGMKGSLKPNDPDVANRINVLWRHSLMTAYFASWLNKELDLGFRGQEYSAALLHDIGRIVMLLADAKTSRQIDPLNFRERHDILCRERTAIGTDHCELGLEYARRQCLPEKILQVIQHHHAPEGASEEHQLLTDLVAAADDITNHALRERKISNYDHRTCPSFERLLSRKTPGYIQRFPQTLAGVARAATRETRMALRAGDQSEMARA